LPGFSTISHQQLFNEAVKSFDCSILCCDWDSDTDLKEQTFFDLSHLEIRTDG
jgi:hypothetical protein